MIEWQWGNSPEHTIWLFIDLTKWAVPISFDWRKVHPSLGGFSLHVSITMLCFNLHYEYWKWGKGDDYETIVHVKELDNGV